MIISLPLFLTRDSLFLRLALLLPMYLLTFMLVFFSSFFFPPTFLHGLNKRARCTEADIQVTRFFFLSHPFLFNWRFSSCCELAWRRSRCAAGQSRRALALCASTLARRRRSLPTPKRRTQLSIKLARTTLAPWKRPWRRACRRISARSCPLWSLAGQWRRRSTWRSPWRVAASARLVSTSFPTISSGFDGRCDTS